MSGKEETCMWENMVCVLQEMLAVYENLLLLSQKKRDALVAAQVQQVEEFTHREEALILEAGKLENKLHGIVQDMSQTYGLTPQDVTMAKLLEKAEADIYEQLTAINEKFSLTAAQLQSVNKINTSLIEQALTLINYNINLLTQSTASPVYAAGGKRTEDAKSKTIFDKKI